MTTIPLTPTTNALFDDRDYALVSAHKWYSLNGYAATTISGRTVYMHRLILGLTGRTPQIDHINMERADNRRSNIRACTDQENKRNRAARSDSSSGIKGVSWDKPNQKWRAKINVGGRHIHLGRFINQKDAKTAYDAAAKQYFNEFARS